jgi:Predicted membrane protein
MTEIAAAVPWIDYLQVIGAAAVPITELKGAILYYYFNSTIPILLIFILSLIGTSIPVPFVLIFIKAIIRWAQKSRVKFFNSIANWLLGKVDKHKERVLKYGYWFIFLIDAIPVPGFGVYTGSLLAGMLDLKIGKSLVAILLGNVVAGVLVTIFSIGLQNIMR